MGKQYLAQVPVVESLIFVILAFGGLVSWDEDGAPFMEADQSITHQLVHVPTKGQKYPSRLYVLRQWIYDCVNARVILPTDEYLVGRKPPPHLSPFVDNEAKGNVPECAETIEGLPAEVVPITGVGKEVVEDVTNLLAENDNGRKEAAEGKRKNEVLEKHCHKELKEELQGLSCSSQSV
ncbi:pescadillo-related [Euphorbia peplus]|nr:pescadillo-related [Euphorbia peplus]